MADRQFWIRFKMIQFFFNIVKYVRNDEWVYFCFRTDSLGVQYGELEDEFRLALQIESNRFTQVTTLNAL